MRRAITCAVQEGTENLARTLRQARAILIAVLLAALVPGTASAATATATLGSTPAGGESAPEVVTCFSAVQALSDPGSPSYVAPATGTIKSWTVQGMTETIHGSFLDSTVQLQVYRPDGASWILVAESAERVASAQTLNTFTTSVPIQKGDILGLRSSIGCTYTSVLGGDTVASFTSHPATGTSLSLDNAPLGFARLNVSAVEEYQLPDNGGGGGGGGDNGGGGGDNGDGDGEQEGDNDAGDQADHGNSGHQAPACKHGKKKHHGKCRGRGHGHGQSKKAR